MGSGSVLRLGHERQRCHPFRQIGSGQRLGRAGKTVAHDPVQPRLCPRDRDIGKPFPQGDTRLHPPGPRGDEQVGRENLHIGPLRALRLVDRHRRTMQEGRAHMGGGRDEGFFLVRKFDLDDRGGRDLRVLGADHMQPGKTRLLAGAEIDDLRPLDQPPRLKVDAPPAVLQGQLDPVADQGLTGQQIIRRRAISGAERLDQPDTGLVAPHQHR